MLKIRLALVVQARGQCRWLRVGVRGAGAVRLAGTVPEENLWPLLKL